MMKSNMDREGLEKRLNWYEKKYGSYIEKRGLKNWRNLFVKPNNYEWTILFMLLMAGFIAWAYQVDTATCRETMMNLETTCRQYCESEAMRLQANEELSRNFSDINFSEIMITAEDLVDEG